MMIRKYLPVSVVGGEENIVRQNGARLENLCHCVLLLATVGKHDVYIVSVKTNKGRRSSQTP